MSRKPESVFIESVHRHLPKHVYHLKQHNMYVSGPADVYYSALPCDLWVEYKYLTHIPRSDNIKLDLSPLQAMWLRSRFEEGRNVSVILGLKDGGIIFRDLTWERAFKQVELLPFVLDRKELAEWITQQATNAHHKTFAAISDRNQRGVPDSTHRLATVLPSKKNPRRPKV